MKAALKQVVKLSPPLYVTRKLYAYTDASVTQGVSYILLQRKDENDPSGGYKIMSCDNTTCKKGRVSYWPFQAKLALFQRKTLLEEGIGCTYLL